MRVLASLVILWLAALALWMLQGVLAPLDAATAAARAGLLPPVWRLALGLAAATALAVWIRPRPAGVLPLALAVGLVAPWLPVPIPPVALALVGPAAGVFAAAIVLAWLAGCAAVPRRVPRVLTDPRRAPAAAALTAALLFGLAAWLTKPMRPGGDEPHYLVVTESVLFDGDLRTENNYARGDYRAYVDMPLRPHYLRRGQDGEIYSIHPPGVPLLVLPAFAAAGYPGVLLFLVIVSACGMGLVWRIAWTLTGSPAASWFAWATATLSAPVVFHAAAVYPDGPAAVLVLVGVWALVSASRAAPAVAPARNGRWLAAGAALAMLPWLHARLAVLAAVLGALLVWQLAARGGGWRRIAGRIGAFGVLPLASAAGWFAYFWVIYGEPSPAAPYRGAAFSAAAYMPSSLGGLLFDHQFGLLPNAPVFLAAICGLGALAWGSRQPHPARPWIAAALALLVGSYLIAIAPMRMWWAGWSAPARFLVPVLPALALASAAAWQAARLGVTRAVLLMALGASAGLTAILVVVDRGRLAYNVRDGWGLLLDWLSPLVALPRGMPSFHRQPESLGFVEAGVWLAALVGTWLVLRRLDPWLQDRGARAAAVPGAFVLAAALTVSAVWALGTGPLLRIPRAQLDLLRQVEPDGRDVAVRFAPFARLAPGELPGLLRLRTDARWLDSRDPAFFVLPGEVPAGTYRLHVESESSDDVRLAVGVGHGPFTLQAFEVAGEGADHVLPIDLPVDVGSLVVRGPAGRRAAIRDLVVEPVAVRPERRRGGGVASQAVRYRGATCYFMDRGAHVDSRGFWIPAGGSAEVVMVPHRGHVAGVRLQNAAGGTRVALRSGGWALDVDLSPDEVRLVRVPVRAPGLVTIGLSGDGRGADRAAGGDRRSLGIRVELP